MFQKLIYNFYIYHIYYICRGHTICRNDISSKYLNHLKKINSGKWEKNTPEYNNAINLSEKYDKLYNK